MMRLRSVITCLVAAGVIAGAASQSRPTPRPGEVPESFRKFRQDMLDDFHRYRNSLLEDYDRFLSEGWENHERRPERKADSAPKPLAVPHLDITMPTIPDIVIPEVKVPATDYPTVSLPTVPVGEKPAVAEPEAPQPHQPAATDITFQFCGMPVTGPALDISLPDRLVNPSDFGAQWRAFAKNHIADKVNPHIEATAASMALNDYLTYELASAWVDAVAGKQSKASVRASLLHYLMANMGYDVRLALSESGQPVMLLNLKQMCYGRPYLEIGGKNYYVFTFDGLEPRSVTRNITTCKLPADADLGRPVNLALGELNLPYKPETFNISNGELTLTGEVNSYLRQLLHRYPQMPMAYYAVANLQPQLRHTVVEQLKSQLAGRPKLEAVNSLLHFVQEGFEYATDEEFHGFEKPYFFEEMLLYPKCDCEDRSIFYTYLLWNVLGVNNQLLNYPGHESAAVSIDGADLHGANYICNGRTYYISDPTYIGADTGQCIPTYQAMSPKVDYTY